MEAVELRRLDSSESLLCLRFCDGEEVQVSQATLLRSPIISNVLEVLDEEEDDAPACGVVHAPAGLVRNWLRFVQPIEEEEQPAKGLDSSGDGPALTLALKMFRALPAPLVLSVLNHLRAHDIEELFAAIPEEFHPQVVQAYFPEVAQNQSLSLEYLLYMGGRMHPYQHAKSTGVHQSILNAVAKIPDMKHISLELRTSVQQFMSSGLRNMTRLTFLHLEGAEGLPDVLPALVSLRALQLVCYSQLTDGLSVLGLMESISHCSVLESLDLQGWLRDRPFAAGATLAASLKHCSTLHTLKLSIASGSLDKHYQLQHSTMFHSGILQARVGKSTSTSPHQRIDQASDQLFLHRLKSLHLSKVMLGCKADAETLSEFLGACSSLKDLHLHDIEVNESQHKSTSLAVSLAPGFRTLHSLRTLDMRIESFQVTSMDARLNHFYEINDESMAALAEAFEQLTSLESLRFTAQCSAVGSKHLADSLSALTSLTSLFLENVSLRRYVPEEGEDDFGLEPEPFDEAAFAMLIAGDGIPADLEAEAAEQNDGQHENAAAAAAALHAALFAGLLPGDAVQGIVQPVVAAVAPHAAEGAEVEVQYAVGAVGGGAESDAPDVDALGDVALVEHDSAAFLSTDYDVLMAAVAAAAAAAVASSSNAADPLQQHPAADGSVALDDDDADFDAALEGAAAGTSTVATAPFSNQRSLTVSTALGGGSAAGRGLNALDVGAAGENHNHNSLPAISTAALDADTADNDAASIEGIFISAVVADDDEESQLAPYAPLEATVTALQGYSSLRSLTLHHTDVGCNVELCSEFGRALSQHSQLEKLTFNENTFCDDGLAALLGNLGGLSCLSELRIVESVSFESSAALAIVLPTFFSLRILSLTHFRPMFFDEPEGRALFQALAQVPALEVLTMHSCHLNEVAAWCLAGSLRCMSSLREIDLSNNELMGNHGVSQVARALSKIPTLEKVNLNDVGATLRGIKTIGWFFKRHKQIKECWVSQRGLEQDEDALDAKRRKFKESMPWLLLYRSGSRDEY